MSETSVLINCVPNLFIGFFYHEGFLGNYFRSIDQLFVITKELLWYFKVVKTLR